MLNSIFVVQVCDATEAPSSNEADNKKQKKRETRNEQQATVPAPNYTLSFHSIYSAIQMSRF